MLDILHSILDFPVTYLSMYIIFKCFIVVLYLQDLKVFDFWNPKRQ